MTPVHHPSWPEPGPGSPRRRSFMGLALVGPAAAAGALLGVARPPAPLPGGGAAVPPQRAGGYHPSAHTERYYALARY
jgi:hypothetical protein